MIALGLFLPAELIARLVMDETSGAFVARPGLQWGMESNMRSAPLHTMSKLRTFRVSTNEDGLRTPYPSGPGEPGTQTVMWLGDSLVFGWGVNDQDTAPHFLDQQLQTLFQGSNYRVINGGMPAYSTVQSYVLLRGAAERYLPKVVVLQLAYHNLKTADTTDASELEALGGAGFSWWMARHSYAYRALRGLLLWIYPPPDDAVLLGETIMTGDVTDADSDQVRVPPSDLREILHSASLLGQKLGFTLVVYFPSNFTTIPARHEAVVLDLESKGELVYIDVPTLFQANGGGNPALRLPWDPNHYTAQGNELVAICIATLLKEEGLVH